MANGKDIAFSAVGLRFRYNSPVVSNIIEFVFLYSNNYTRAFVRDYWVRLKFGIQRNAYYARDLRFVIPRKRRTFLVSTTLVIQNERE